MDNLAAAGANDPDDRIEIADNRTVFLLGAGFSKAISEKMPVLTELGKQVALRTVELPELDRFSGNLETWMDYLASDQPWLSESENLRNRAQFLEVSEALTEIVLEAENAAIEETPTPPDWLVSIVLFWHEHGSQVISLNYDMLVEKALCHALHRARGGPGGSYQSLYSPGLVSIHATGLTGGIRWGPQSMQTDFRLFKPHGSLGWVAPDSGFGRLESAFDLEMDNGWRPDSPTQRSEAAPGKRPLIAPPTSAKASWFGHGYLKVNWQQAVRRLSQADRLVVIGCSLPPTDSSIRLALMDRAGKIPVHVVDVSEQAVKAFKNLMPQSEITATTGDGCVAAYAATL